MPKILDQLELATNTNPAEALTMLPELMQAYHEGIIVELPCKVGKEFYYLQPKPDGAGVQRRIYKQYARIEDMEHIKNHLGKTVFLTREAAEERLESEKK